MPRLVHHAHPPTADFPKDVVLPDLSGRRAGHQQRLPGLASSAAILASCVFRRVRTAERRCAAPPTSCPGWQPFCRSRASKGSSAAWIDQAATPDSRRGDRDAGPPPL